MPTMAPPDVLRDQEALPSAGADAMDFPAASPPAPLARAAAPAPLPMAPTLADVAHDLGPLGPALAQSREAEKQQMVIKANAMRPEYANINQTIQQREALAQNAPKPPALTPPPSRGLRDFLATSENESPAASIGKLIQGMSLFANVAVGGSRRNALGGMAALAGALAGWQAGDADRADRAFKDWEAQTATALKEYDLQRTAYTDALTASGLTLDGRIQKARLTALEQGDTQAMLALESGTIGEMLDLLTKRDDAKAKLTLDVQKMLDARSEASRREAAQRETERHNRETESAKRSEIDMKGRELTMAKPEEVDRLRDDFVKAAKDFVTIRDSYSRVKASAKDPSPAGDLSLLFNYMKILDPGSVVRESEFATAAASGSYGDRMQAAVERAISGKRLADNIRADFVDRASRLYDQQLKLHENSESEYKRLARTRNIDESRAVPDLVGRDLRSQAPPTGTPAPGQPGSPWKERK